MNVPAAEQPLLSILRCARPILLYNDCYEYPYSISGTAFIVRFSERLFVVTAKHALRLRDFNPNQFRVQYHPERAEMLPTRALYLFRDTQLDDSDQNDVAAWDLDAAQTAEQLFGEYTPYELNRAQNLEELNPASDYLYRGYPIQTRNIDFQERQYDQDSVSGAADYIGRSRTIARVHELRFRNLGELTELDGLSGSPVFQTRRLEGRYSTESLAGMLIRGTVESGTGYFLEYSRIVELLTDIVAGLVDDRYDRPR